jgi:GNAT superfamily N-acetyltransferase
MWIDQGYRGRGYGRALLNAFVAEACSRGARWRVASRVSFFGVSHRLKAAATLRRLSSQAPLVIRETARRSSLVAAGARPISCRRWQRDRKRRRLRLMAASLRALRVFTALINANTSGDGIKPAQIVDLLAIDEAIGQTDGPSASRLSLS